MSGREKIQQKHSERLMKHLSNERKTSLRRTVTMRKITHDSARHGGRPCYCRHTANGMWVRGRACACLTKENKKKIRFVLLLHDDDYSMRVKSCLVLMVDGRMMRWNGMEAKKKMR